MSTRNSEFFLDDAPREDGETNLLPHLKPWHRIAICVAFVAAMLGYLRWLTGG